MPDHPGERAISEPYIEACRVACVEIQWPLQDSKDRNATETHGKARAPMYFSKRTRDTYNISSVHMLKPSPVNVSAAIMIHYPTNSDGDDRARLVVATRKPGKAYY